MTKRTQPIFNPTAPLDERVRVVVEDVHHLADAEHEARLAAVTALREHSVAVEHHNRHLVLLRDMFLANRDEVQAEGVPLHVTSQGTITYEGEQFTYRRKIDL